jgi:hypothetical protein
MESSIASQLLARIDLLGIGLMHVSPATCTSCMVCWTIWVVMVVGGGVGSVLGRTTTTTATTAAVHDVQRRASSSRFA